MNGVGLSAARRAAAHPSHAATLTGIEAHADRRIDAAQHLHVFLLIAAEAHRNLLGNGVLVAREEWLDKAWAPVLVLLLACLMRLGRSAVTLS